MCQKGRAWIELSRENLAHNVRELQRILPKHTAMMPAIKANAYGHGAALVGKALQDMGISDFCVATVQEGIELRLAGITGQILVLGYTHPSQFNELAHYNLVQTVIDYPYAQVLNDYGKALPVHVGIDTGMRRLGERSDAIEKIRAIWSFPHLKITGVYSHLCVSDGTTAEERAFTQLQIKRFRSVVDVLHKSGIYGFKTHIQSSYGILNDYEPSFDYARTGIALYGVLSRPHDHVRAAADLRPVLSLKARVECVKTLSPGEAAGYGRAFTAACERTIAVVSIGYADGIPRNGSQTRYALLHGQKVPIVGRICMDQLFIDVTGIPNVAPGDEAVLIGSSGIQQISASDLAEQSGTISNEILSRLGSRLERIEVRA